MVYILHQTYNTVYEKLKTIIYVCMKSSWEDISLTKKKKKIAKEINLRKTWKLGSDLEILYLEFLYLWYMKLNLISFHSKILHF